VAKRADTRSGARPQVRPARKTKPPQPTAKVAAEAPEQVIAGLAAQLAHRAGEFERARDPRCVFARAYEQLMHELAEAVPDAGFEDPAWVAELALVFAEYYFRALREFDDGTLEAGAWSSVFEASARGKTSVLEELVLGMMAHIVNDLPFALCDTGLTTPGGASRVADYHRLNEVLGRAIARVQGEVSRRYQPLLFVLDHLFEDYDEILTNYGLRISRATAWYNALRLLDPQARPAAVAAIARSPEVTRREILEPPLLTLRYALRAARLLSRVTRRWPSGAPEVGSPLERDERVPQPNAPLPA
jgi:hypothetical protein